jgi:anti-sigma factor RsiW
MDKDTTLLLDRLLGPAGAEVGCDTCFEELDRYVELELAGEDADAAVPGLRAHLAGCPACREEHESLRALVGGEQAL